VARVPILLYKAFQKNLKLPKLTPMLKIFSCYFQIVFTPVYSTHGEHKGRSRSLTALKFRLNKKCDSMRFLIRSIIFRIRNTC
jgi:hypothetical protein